MFYFTERFLKRVRERVVGCVIVDILVIGWW